MSAETACHPEEVFARLAMWLEGCGMAVERTEHGLHTPARGAAGCEVGLDWYGDEYIGWMGEWHGHFGSDEEAARWFHAAVTGECRLKVWARGRCEYRWDMQMLEGGEWRTVGVTGLLLYPFWRKRTVRYLGNPRHEREP